MRRALTCHVDSATCRLAWPSDSARVCVKCTSLSLPGRLATQQHHHSPSHVHRPPVARSLSSYRWRFQRCRFRATRIRACACIDVPGGNGFFLLRSFILLHFIRSRQASCGSSRPPSLSSSSLLLAAHGANTQTHRVARRYYVGHKGKFGHEFLEFEFRPDGACVPLSHTITLPIPASKTSTHRTFSVFHLCDA
jgi:hypothetical protein